MRPRKALLIYCRNRYTASLASFVIRTTEHIAPLVCRKADEAEYLLDRGRFDGLLVLPTKTGCERDLALTGLAVTIPALHVIVARRGWARGLSMAWPRGVESCKPDMASIRPALRFHQKRGPKPLSELAKIAARKQPGPKIWHMKPRNAKGQWQPMPELRKTA